jgi:hypothetical protein
MNRTQKIIGLTLLIAVITVTILVVAENAPTLLGSTGWHEFTSVGWHGRG